MAFEPEADNAVADVIARLMFLSPLPQIAPLPLCWPRHEGIQQSKHRPSMGIVLKWQAGIKVPILRFRFEYGSLCNFAYFGNSNLGQLPYELPSI